MKLAQTGGCLCGQTSLTKVMEKFGSVLTVERGFSTCQAATIVAPAPFVPAARHNALIRCYLVVVCLVCEQVRARTTVSKAREIWKRKAQR
jgi:hypothetical protein